MTLFGWLLLSVPVPVLALVAWGLREPFPDEPGPAPYDWDRDGL